VLFIKFLKMIFFASYLCENITYLGISFLKNLVRLGLPPPFNYSRRIILIGSRIGGGRVFSNDEPLK